MVVPLDLDVELPALACSWSCPLPDFVLFLVLSCHGLGLDLARATPHLALPTLTSSVLVLVLVLVLV